MNVTYLFRNFLKIDALIESRMNGKKFKTKRDLLVIKNQYTYNKDAKALMTRARDEDDERKDNQYYY